jgi:formate hydrogenlyase subunit 3/multisubunit Na+/H+ antiporter MnhD subunit
MLIVALLLPLLAAIAAWFLDRVVPTRHIGYVAIGTLFISAVILTISGIVYGLPLQMLAVPWMQINDFTTTLTLRFDMLNWVVSVVVLFCSVAGMIGLIHSLPYNLRNYGRLIALLLLHVSIIIIGVAAQDTPLRIFAWGMAALVGGILMRLSGSLPGSNTPLISVVGGIAGAILLLVATFWRQYIPLGALPGTLILCWSLAAFLAMGLLPFHSYMSSLSSAPAILAVFLIPLGIPLLGVLAFIDMAATQAPLINGTWTIVLVVMAILSALGCATGAIGATRLRAMLGWHASTQFALIVLVAISDGRALLLGVPLLLLNAIISTVMIALAIAYIEVRSNTDDLSQLRPRAKIGIAGIMLLIAVASSIGIPGTIGFIARWWVADILLTQAPWVIITLLICGSLQGLAWSVALASIWRRMPRGLTAEQVIVSAIPPWGAWLGSIILAIIIFVGGIIPRFFWTLWLVPLQKRFAIDAAITTPTLPTLEQQIALAGVAVLIVVLPLLAARTRQRQMAGPNEQTTVAVPPQATAESLSLLTGIVRADWLLGGAWQMIIRIGGAIQWMLRLGEERYYVAGLVMGLIVIVLMLI